MMTGFDLLQLRQLPLVFNKLYASLIAWKDLGHGLLPLKQYDRIRLENYLHLLYGQAHDALNERLPKPFAFREWITEGAPEIYNGPELLLQLSWLSALLQNPNQDSVTSIELLEDIKLALIALVYIEEPGELTVDEVLALY